jgi:hypothetical protein
MDRRKFLRVFGDGLVASATMAQAGMVAEFMDWLKRKPVWSFPSKSRGLYFVDPSSRIMVSYRPPFVAADLPSYVVPVLMHIVQEMDTEVGRKVLQLAMATPLTEKRNEVA